MVTEKIKKRLVDEATKFMASERGQKIMQNPQIMQALMKVIEVRSKVQSNIDETVKSLQKALNLATREDLRKLDETLDDLRQKLDLLRQQTETLTDTLAKPHSEPGGGKKKRAE